MNTKGGMDDNEFELYLLNAVFPLFPDAKYQKGKRVLLKVDSGPVRINFRSFVNDAYLDSYCTLVCQT